MARNRHLSKSILDAGWGYLVTHLTHKVEEAGRLVVLVNPTYTSKTCSRCGTLLEHLTLAKSVAHLCVRLVFGQGSQRGDHHSETGGDTASGR